MRTCSRPAPPSSGCAPGTRPISSVLGGRSSPRSGQGRVHYRGTVHSPSFSSGIRVRKRRMIDRCTNRLVMLDTGKITPALAQHPDIGGAVATRLTNLVSTGGASGFFAEINVEMLVDLQSAV